MTEEQYIQKGFNNGYQLQKHDPELSKTLQNGFTDKEHPYAQGFVAGSQEYVNEQSKEKGKGNSPLLAQYRDKAGQSKDNATYPNKEKDSDLER